LRGVPLADQPLFMIDIQPLFREVPINEANDDTMIVHTSSATAETTVAVVVAAAAAFTIPILPLIIL
jgi:hypothetical protein